MGGGGRVWLGRRGEGRSWGTESERDVVRGPCPDFVDLATFDFSSTRAFRHPRTSIVNCELSSSTPPNSADLASTYLLRNPKTGLLGPLVLRSVVEQVAQFTPKHSSSTFCLCVSLLLSLTYLKVVFSPPSLPSPLPSIESA